MVATATLLGAAYASAGQSVNLLLDAVSPTFSPDGTRVAFAYQQSSSYGIATTQANGRGPLRTLYSAANGGAPPAQVSWAGNGLILFVSNYTLMTVPDTGGKATRMFGTPFFVLSPNRMIVAFDHGCDCGHVPDSIRLVDVRGGKPVAIPQPRDVTDEIDGFSPDGRELTFTRYPFRSSGSPTLMVAHIGGGAAEPLVSSGLAGASQIPEGAVHARWSLDGRWIAFVLGQRLEIVSTLGGTPRLLARHLSFLSFAWSPTSTRLAYPDGASGRLATVDVRGHRTFLWQDPSLRYTAFQIGYHSLDWTQWSPDGRKLVFAAGRGDAPARTWIVGADGRGLKQIA